MSDSHTICHLNSQTFKQNKIDIGIDDFCRNADTNMFNYFNNSEFNNVYLKLRKDGENYKP